MTDFIIHIVHGMNRKKGIKSKGVFGIRGFLVDFGMISSAKLIVL